MKKKLEAELISIAHRILKLKNRADIDQLQAETLRLYEKLSVLKFVEDNFADVKPTIGYSSAEGKLEEIYGIEEQPEVKANEAEAEEDKAREDKEAKKSKGKGRQDKEEAPAAGAEKEEAEDKPAGDADPEQEIEEYQASEEEKEETKESDEEPAEDKVEEPIDEAEEAPEEDKAGEAEETEEPEHKIEVAKPEEEVQAMEEGAAAVFEKEDDSTPEEEEKAIDAEVITIEPDTNAEVEEGHDVAFAFERKPAPEEPAKQKEISFEDFHDYKEPEFVKKEDSVVTEDTMAEEGAPEKEEETPAVADDDWRNWEPSKSGNTEQEEPKKEEQPKAEEPKESAVKGNIATREGDKPRSLNDAVGKTISLGLNDRIAFEKHLFGGSSDDLNRVLSQLNTHHSFEEAKNFIEDLVKPDYNNWKGKEEYEERFMALVEKKFE